MLQSAFRTRGRTESTARSLELMLVPVGKGGTSDAAIEPPPPTLDTTLLRLAESDMDRFLRSLLGPGPGPEVEFDRAVAVAFGALAQLLSRPRGSPGMRLSPARRAALRLSSLHSRSPLN